METGFRDIDQSFPNPNYAESLEREDTTKKDILWYRIPPSERQPEKSKVETVPCLGCGKDMDVPQPWELPYWYATV